MNISLTPQLENYVKNKVDTGRYTSASEVIREALRLLESQDPSSQLDTKLIALKQAIAEGVNSLNAGEGKPFDPKKIKAKGRSRLNG